MAGQHLIQGSGKNKMRHLFWLAVFLERDGFFEMGNYFIPEPNKPAWRRSL
jgi:hypothetical protein